jgi:hypothetical protein
LTRAALLGAALVWPGSITLAAKPAQEVYLPDPIITAAATPYNASFVAANVFDNNSQTDYASQSLGANTFIDFDFGTPTTVSHFYHKNRSAADTIGASQLIFSNDPTFATGTFAVPITHTDQVNAVTYALQFGPQTARYVRWDVTAAGPGNNQGANEIAFLNLTGNYAQISDPAITAAATQFNASFPAANVFDNVPTSHYASQGLGANTFIDFDFGAAKRISGFELDNRSAHPLDAILGSNLLFSNDPTFATGVTTIPITHAIQDGPLLYGFADQFARYVRWDVTNVQPGGVTGNQGAKEIGFYASVPADHIAIAPTAVTNSSAPFSPLYVPENMFDENPATEFASASVGVGTFVEMDFGGVQNFAGFEHMDRNAKVDWTTGAKLTFSMDPTFDASDPVITIAQSSAAYETFAPIAARYVRWEATSMTAGNFGNLGGREMVFYATSVPEPGTLALCGMGLAALGLVRLRRKR